MRRVPALSTGADPELMDESPKGYISHMPEPWRSARWFESNAAPGFVKSVGSFKTDRVNVRDDF